MKLPYPIQPARIHTPGRFCDKRDGKPQLLVLLMASVMAVTAAAAFVRNFF